jgi:hypothetical protein
MVNSQLQEGPTPSKTTETFIFKSHTIKPKMILGQRLRPVEVLPCPWQRVAQSIGKKYLVEP